MKTCSTAAGWCDPALAVAYLDGLADPVVVLDVMGTIREANAAFVAFTAIPRTVLLDQPVEQALEAASWLAPFVAAATELAGRRGRDRFLLQLSAPETEDRTLWLTAVPLPDSRDTPLLAVRVEDITEMARERAAKDAERIAARDTARALERLNEELEGFSYSVAHDLRAPLRFIDKFAYLLMDRHSAELSPDALQYAEQIREGTRQMAQLVEDLLQFSRVTGQELKRETIDMTRLARQVIAEVQHDIEDRDVAFTVADLGTAQGDPALVRQVFANLIENAVKFTRRCTDARVEIACDTAAKPPVYTVADNGVGFDAAEAERLFTVFQRYHQPDDFEGSGVGLAVVKRIVSRHGGTVWAESRVGHGARFLFTLAPAPTGTGSP